MATDLMVVLIKASSAKPFSMSQWKNYENWPIFAKVIKKRSTFLRHSVLYKQN